MQADDEPKTDAKAKNWSGVDAKSEEVLRQLGAALKSAKSIHADVVVETAFDGPPKREVKVKGTVDVQQPNLFSLRCSSDKDPAAGMEINCDGKNLVLHHRRLKQFTEAKAPSKLLDVGRSYQQFGHFETGMLFMDAMAPEPAEALLAGVTKGEYAGIVKVDGKDAHHLKFKQANLDWEIWITAEDQPTVIKMLGNATFPGIGKSRTVETYSNWKWNAEPTKGAFDFKPPEESKKVPRFRPAASPVDDK
jgi:hypothetical protein